MINQDRYQRGWEKLKEIDGAAGERVIDSLKDIAPDFAAAVGHGHSNLLKTI